MNRVWTAPALSSLCALASLWACTAPTTPVEPAAEDVTFKMVSGAGEGGGEQPDSVAHELPDRLFRLCEKMALREDASLDEALLWAKHDAWRDVRRLAAKRHGLTEDQVDEQWEKRGESAEVFQHGYGAGTFVLGEDAGVGLDVPAVKRATPDVSPEGSGRLQTLEEMIQEKLREKAAGRKKLQKRPVNAGALAAGPLTASEWWKYASTRDRASVLMATFAESSGRVKVVALRMQYCANCCGTGVVHSSACPRCKSLGFDRIVVFQ